MTFFKRKRVANSETNKYAGAEDFRQVFSDDRDVLYRLSLLLTGDHERAEQCFVAGIEDSVNTNRVFKEWARTWAKRTIIQNAISALNPRPRQHAMSALPENVVEIGASVPSIQDRDPEISSVLALEDFERFVFVMTVLEGRSEHECALLLDSSLRDVRNARIWATEQIATAASSPIAASHSSTAGSIRRHIVEAVQHNALPERQTPATLDLSSRSELSKQIAAVAHYSLCS